MTGWLTSAAVALAAACGSNAGTPTGIVVATDQAGRAITTDSGYVYWVTRSAVLKTPLRTDGALPIPLASGLQLTSPDSIALDSNFVYWADAGNPMANDGTIMKVALYGGDPIMLAVGLPGPRAIAVDGDSIYWTDGTSIFSMSSAGVETRLVGGQSFVIALSVQNGRVYWISGDPGTVSSVALTGGPAASLAKSTFAANGQTLDAASVYWSTGGGLPQGGSISSVSAVGGTPSVLASNEDYPGYLAVDAVAVYWTTQREVRRVSIEGGSAETLASNANEGLHPLALSEMDVYWACDQVGDTPPSIRRIPK